MSSGKKYITSSVITTLTLVINKIIQFLLIAILTRLMSQEAYGRYSIFQSWVNILSIVIGGSLASSFGIAKTDFGAEYPKYLSSCVGLSYVFLAIAFVIGILLKGNWSTLYFLLVLMHSFNINIMTNFDVMQIFNMRFKKASIVSVSSSFVSAIFIIVSCILISGDDGMAAITALSIVYLFYSLYCQYAMFCEGKCVFSEKYWSYAFENSVLMVFHNLSLVILNQIDRIMIGDMLSESYAAIYSVIYGLSIVISMLWGGVHKVWIPWVYQKMEKHDYAIVTKVNSFMMVIMAVLSVNYCFITPEIIKIFLPKSYWDGMDMMPAIVFGYFFSFLFSVYVNIVYMDKKMASITFGTIIAAVTNVVTNYIFLRLYGYKVSAYTTLLSYFVLFIYHHILNIKKHYFDSKVLFTIISGLVFIMCICKKFTYSSGLRYVFLIAFDIVIFWGVIHYMKNTGYKIKDLWKFFK